MFATRFLRPASSAFAPRAARCMGTDCATAVSSLTGRSLLSIDDLSTAELKGLLALSAELKAAFKADDAAAGARLPLRAKSAAMIFQKRSTRTRVSTETGMALLGGHALFLGPGDVQLGVNESLNGMLAILGTSAATTHSDCGEEARAAVETTWQLEEQVGQAVVMVRERLQL